MSILTCVSLNIRLITCLMCLISVYESVDRERKIPILAVIMIGDPNRVLV